MRKRFLFLTLAALAVLGLLFAACGDDDDNEGDDGGGGTATATTGGGATTPAGASPTDEAAPTTAGGGASEPLELTITAAGFEFDTPTIGAAPGQEVNITLVNEDTAPHSFTVGSTDVAQASGGEEADGSFTASEDTTEFHCKFHPQMTGTITVSEDAAANTNDGGGSFGSVGY